MGDSMAYLDTQPDSEGERANIETMAKINVKTSLFSTGWFSCQVERIIFWWELRKHSGRPATFSLQLETGGVRTTYEFVGKITNLIEEPEPPK